MKPILTRAVVVAASMLLPAQPVWAAGEMNPPLTIPPAAAPAMTAPASPGPATQSQAITVGAGNGILLRLPRAASTVMSANPDIARVQPASPTSLFLMGVAPGHTTVVATMESGAAIVQYDVTVSGGVRPAGGVISAAPSGIASISAATATAAQAAIAQMVAGATSVRVRAAGQGLVLEGTVPTAAAAQQANAIARGYVGEKGTVTDTMTVLESIQVNVRVRIAEIDRNITRQLGFNWQALGKGGNWQFGVLTGAATGGFISPLVPLGLSALSGASAVPYQVGAGYSSGTRDINGVIDALAADQLISILAEPNLTAQSGEAASFLAGGEFPVPIAGSSNNGTPTISVEFKQYGVSLNLVPTVLSSGRLNLRVRPEVSQLSTVGAVSVPVTGGVITIPALTVRRAETTVELGSGQSFAIAGLLQKTSSNQTNALPGLGEVPVLGALFKSNDFQRGESELVIIVTPYIVKPALTPAAFVAPTDGFKPATDLDRILFGRQIAPGAVGQPRIDAGFILK
ncbi:MAG TPA: type II and III secretion system protein family protein [Rhodopila sp.]|nr:type II and III secretion system protein family protein [Rhodopila sp.]